MALIEHYKKHAGCLEALDQYRYDPEDIYMTLCQQEIIGNVALQEYCLLRLMLILNPESGRTFINNMQVQFHEAWQNLLKSGYVQRYSTCFRHYIPNLPVHVDYTQFGNIHNFTRFIEEEMTFQEWDKFKDELGQTPGLFEEIVSHYDVSDFKTEDSRWIEMLLEISAYRLDEAANIYRKYPTLFREYESFIEGLHGYCYEDNVFIDSLTESLNDNNPLDSRYFLWYFRNRNLIVNNSRFHYDLREMQKYPSIAASNINKIFYIVDVTQTSRPLAYSIISEIKRQYKLGKIKEPTMLDYMAFVLNIPETIRNGVMLLNDTSLEDRDITLHYSEFQQIQTMVELFLNQEHSIKNEEVHLIL